MIQKKLHYIWFGKQDKPELVKKCIASWYDKISDFEIIEWNEDNIDINHPFFNYCLENHQWAYASDYARIYLLNKYGGVYVDTDIELIQPFSNRMMEASFFTGYESEKLINFGVFGSVPNHQLLNAFLKEYDSVNYIKPIPHLLTPIIEKFDLVEDNIFIAPQYVFYPLDYNFEWVIPKESIEYYTIHHWGASWKDKFNKFRADYLIFRVDNLLTIKEKEILYSLIVDRELRFYFKDIDSLIDRLPINIKDKKELYSFYLSKVYIEPLHFNFTLILRIIKEYGFVYSNLKLIQQFKIIVKCLINKR